MPDLHLSRRNFLAGAGSLTIGIALTQGLQVPRARADDPLQWVDTTSLNGWPIVGAVDYYIVEGSNEAIGACSDDVALILCNVARRYNYELQQLLPGDLTSFQTDLVIGAPYESNYLSGTAIALRPGAFPIGSSGDLLDSQVTIIRDILAQHEGVIAWGGDLEPVKQSHFEITVPPNDLNLARVAANLRSTSAVIGESAGSIDSFDPTRVAESEVFAEEQGVID